MNNKNTESPSCKSRFSCSPCLVIWNVVLLVVIAQYFLR